MYTVVSYAKLLSLFHNFFKDIQTLVGGSRYTGIVTQQRYDMPLVIFGLCQNGECKIDLSAFVGNGVEQPGLFAILHCVDQNRHIG
jgi:lysozyme family protein